MSSIVMDNLVETLPSIFRSMQHDQLNPPQALENCRDHHKMLTVLRMNGIFTQNKNYPHLFLRRYYVYLFQHRVLHILKADDPAVWLHQAIKTQNELLYDDVTEQPEEKETARIVSFAVRSLYALGLDYGMVYIGVESPAKMRVIDVFPVPKLTNEIDDKFSRALQDYEFMRKKEKTSVNEVVLGADPEFALRDLKGEMGIASQFLGREGVIGCDAARFRMGTTRTNQLPLVEIRPEPSASPEQVMYSITHAMKKGLKKITDPSLEWIAGGMPFADYPIGGHIHFSGIPLNFQVIRALDIYVCLPLALIEDEGCKRRRPRYGFLGDFREKSYGGFEYRTLPSWLVTPDIAKGVLTLAKVAATCYQQLKQHKLLTPHLQRAYYSGDKETLTSIVKSLHKELNTLALYDLYKKVLDPFFVYLLSGKRWPAEMDIRRAWKLLV